MARKPNYDFEKRRKEMDRKAKKDAKREDRLQRRRAGLENDGVEGVESGESGEPTSSDTPAAGGGDTSER